MPPVDHPRLADLAALAAESYTAADVKALKAALVIARSYAVTAWKVCHAP